MKLKFLVLSGIILVAAFLRFYNLSWGAPYFFHPDERNMAHAVSQLQPDSLNPGFFAYGQFPLYLSYFSGLLAKLSVKDLSGTLTFPQAIFWLRFWSALSSTLTVLLVYLTARKLSENWNLRIGYLAALLAAFTPGLIQSAHFGTTESLLTFFFMLVIYLSIKLVSEKTADLKPLIIISVALGLAISTKVSAVLFYTAPGLALILRLNRKNIIKTFFEFFFLVYFSFLIFFLTSPYNFIDFNGFRGSINYETNVALGVTKVFYTRQFENTLPLFFQLAKIFPYALGVPIFVIGLLGFMLMCVKLIINLLITLSSKFKGWSRFGETGRNHNLELKTHFIIIFSFIIYFLPNAFLFTKWTRFVTPIFPLFSIFSAYFLYQIITLFKKSKIQSQISNLKSQNYNSKVKNFKFLALVLTFAFCVLSFQPGLAFFTIYARPDVRVTASQWIYDNIPSGSYILSETANVIDIPLQLDVKHYSLTQSLNPISFNFYELDENPDRFEELLLHLEQADYIFIPSRRIYKNHMKFPEKYLLTWRYYDLLFSGKLGFEKIAEFSSYPSLSLRPNREGVASDHLPGVILPDEASEESYTVFDHPVIRIYKKIISYSSEEYRKLLTE